MEKNKRKPSLNPLLTPFWTAKEVKSEKERAKEVLHEEKILEYHGDAGRPIKYRVLLGGRMSSKSHDAAGFAIALSNYTKQNILCLRRFQNRIEDSVYTLLKNKITAFGLQKNFTIKKNSIINNNTGSVFNFYGLEKNHEDIKSYEGATIAWFEECQNLTEDMYNTVRPTVMRNEGAEMWFLFNPKFSADFIYRKMVLNPPSGTVVRKINYDENPFLGEQALEDIASAFREDPELADHVYNGTPLEDTEGTIIKISWLNACIDAHTKIKATDGDLYLGEGVVGFDVADDGEDYCTNITMIGSVVTDILEWKAREDELYESTLKTLESARKAQGIISETNAKLRSKDAYAKNFNVSINYDAIGVGASVGGTLQKLNFKRYYKFKAGSKAIRPDSKYKYTETLNKDYFSNVKAQGWFNLADRCKNTYNAVNRGMKFEKKDLISFDSELLNKRLLHKLFEELTTPKRRFDNLDRIRVESKDELLKRGIKSPNLADAAVLASFASMRVRCFSEIL